MRVSSSLRRSVALLGTAGGVGRPLAMQLRRSPLVMDLRLYDLTAAKGVAEDLAHMPTGGKVSGYGPGQLSFALDGARVVLICAGVPRKVGMLRDDLFNTNALVVDELATEVARCCPDAIVGVITNPLNSMVAVAAAAMEKTGNYDPRKLFGLMVLDVDRATAFLSEFCGDETPFKGRVPVIGGHSGNTLVPLFSQTGIDLPRDKAETFAHRMRCAGDDVVRLLQGRGSSSLSSASAAGEWVDRVLRALDGEKGIIDYNLIDSPLQAPKCRFFSTPHELGPHGVEKILPLPKLNEFEELLLDRCLPDLEKNIRKGLDFHRPGDDDVS